MFVGLRILGHSLKPLWFGKDLRCIRGCSLLPFNCMDRQNSNGLNISEAGTLDLVVYAS